MIIPMACGPRPVPTGVPETKKAPAPYDLRAETANGSATLFWSVNRTSITPISGYNIYLAEERAVKDLTAWKNGPGRPYNHGPYPGDTDGDITRESFPLNNLANGTALIAIVKAVGIDGTESPSSNIAAFTPLAGGEFVITTNHLASDGGFNFEGGRSLPARDPLCDIYLYAITDKVGLSSPSRLGAGLRMTSFMEPSFNGSQMETVEIRRGDRFMVKVKAGSAKIRIEKILGQYPDISAQIRYTYYPDGD